jgi:hypothetical protein
LLCQQIFGEEDHSKGTVIERSDSSKPSIQKLSMLKVISHALHFRYEVELR